MKAQFTRILTGIAIIAVGAGFLLDAFNVIEFGNFMSSWWPLAVILAGVLVWLNDSKNYFWSLLLVGIGILFQLRELDIVDVNPWQIFWPLVIITVGLSIVFKRATHTGASKSDRDDVTAILGGSDQKNTSDDFKGSKLTAVMGGAKLDLRKATIKKEATVEAFVLCGGIELVVPREITVRNQTSAILGGVEDKSEREGGKNAPVLYITGDVIMGGIEIKN